MAQRKSVSPAARRLGRELKRAREDASLGQEQAAELLGVSVVTLSRRENGRAPAEPPEAARMRAVYAQHGQSSGDMDVARDTSPAAVQAAPDSLAYWRGRMERTGEITATLARLVGIVDTDVRALLDSGVLGAVEGASVPRPSDEEMAALQAVRRRRIAQKMRELEEHGPPREPPNAPPAPKRRAGGE